MASIAAASWRGLQSSEADRGGRHTVPAVSSRGAIVTPKPSARPFLASILRVARPAFAKAEIRIRSTTWRGPMLFNDHIFRKGLGGQARKVCV